MALEQGAGVLGVLFGVGFGGGDAVKRFVENADDAVLFRATRIGDLQFLEQLVVTGITKRIENCRLKLIEEELR